MNLFSVFFNNIVIFFSIVVKLVFFWREEGDLIWNILSISPLHELNEYEFKLNWCKQSSHRHDFGNRIREKFGGNKAFSVRIRGKWGFFGKIFLVLGLFRTNLGNTLIILGPELRKKLGGTGLFRKMSFFRGKIGGIMVDWGDIQGNFGLE